VQEFPLFFALKFSFQDYLGWTRFAELVKGCSIFWRHGIGKTVDKSLTVIGGMTIIINSEERTRVIRSYRSGFGCG